MSDAKEEPSPEEGSAMTPSVAAVENDENNVNDRDPEQQEADGGGVAVAETTTAATAARLSKLYAMKSLTPGESEVEKLANKIEAQRTGRIPIVKNVRSTFLQTCRHIAEEEECQPRSKIPSGRLIAYRDEIQTEVDGRMDAQGCYSKFCRRLGFFDEKVTLLGVLDRAVERVRSTGDDFFFYQDFNYYNTRLVSRWPWMRNSTSVSVFLVFFYFVFTPVWFCHIVPDQQVCPSDPEGNRSYYGWLTALYFASTTMSTVGYGDVSVQKDTRGYVLVGIVFMIVSLLIAVSAFSAAVDEAFSPLSDMNSKLVSFFTGGKLEGKMLHQQMRKLRIVKLWDIFFQFTLLNVIGMLLARPFVRNYDSTTDWTYMTTFYWAVQTTTTVGYGDLDMPFDFRWFQVLYLTIGTYFVGGALGKLASLKQELEATRRAYAWQRRVVSRGLIMDLEGNDDGVIDQYEFVVASLLQLGKITSGDIAPVMDRFRQLSGEKGYISAAEEQTVMEDDDFEVGEDCDGVKQSYRGDMQNKRAGGLFSGSIRVNMP